MYNKKKLIIAARGSLLSRAQVEFVRELLAAAGVQTEFLPVRTKGDRNRTDALRAIGGDGLFVREVEKYLLDGTADLAVHCGKDLPYRIAEGLVIGGVPAAEDPRDCLLYPAGRTMEELRKIGTGSARRISELKRHLPQVECVEIRGNINTRIDKLRDGQYDGILLAKAGLERLKPDLQGLSVRVFAPDEMIPAACQGILALECRADDAETIEVLRAITDDAARERFETERELFCRMQADCATAVGVYAEFGEQEHAPGASGEEAAIYPAGSGNETAARPGDTAENTARTRPALCGDVSAPRKYLRIRAMFDEKTAAAEGAASSRARLIGEILEKIYSRKEPE